jgi:hypothetical protein
MPCLVRVFFTFNQPTLHPLPSPLSPLPSHLFSKRSSQAASPYALDKRYRVPPHLYIFIS